MSATATPAVTVRQAVCDRGRAVVGYEILAFDPGAEAGARTTAVALLEAFTADLDLVAPHHPAYLTVAPDALRDLDVLPVAPERAVLQVDATAIDDPEALDALRRLAGLGYVIGVRDPEPEAVALTDVFALARVNVAGLEPHVAAGRVRALRFAGVEVHALGVASIEVFDACAAAGAIAFQGPFRELPRLAGGPAVDVGGLTSAIDLMGGAEDFEALEAAIVRDLGLSYRLLRYANSAFFARRREVGTVREAMAMLGERMTRRWATVVALAGTGAQRPDGLLVDALLRGRMLEELAGDLPGLDRDRAFTVGLFSLLDALVGRPMEEALQGLGLPAEVEAALLRREPPYGALLERALCHLRGEVGGPGVERLDAAYRAALAWLEPMLVELRDGRAGIGG
jgi:c-di-GMP phosphodiesterase